MLISQVGIVCDRFLGEGKRSKGRRAEDAKGKEKAGKESGPKGERLRDGADTTVRECKTGRIRGPRGEGRQRRWVEEVIQGEIKGS